jgi:ribosomal-protein-alanine N-acetyltransferase
MYGAILWTRGPGIQLAFRWLRAVVEVMVRVEPVTRQWAEALAEGDAVFTERFGIPVEDGWSGFPEALPLIVEASQRSGPNDWGPHLFFDVDGTLVGNGGWKGGPVDGAVELGYAIAPARQGRGIATAVVDELVRRARIAGVRTVLAHTLAQESASTTVLKRCSFTRVGEVRDPVDGVVWRWELGLTGEGEPEELTLALAGRDRVDGLQGLWLALHWHHRSTANMQPMVDDRNSWLRRRSFYVERLDDGNAFLVIARNSHKNIGYAMVLLEAGPDDTWPLADRYAELHSLSIAPGYRRKGIGTQLMDFIDLELDRRGIRDLRVSVMVGNAEAQRFYERRGLVPAEVVLYRLASGRRADRTPETGPFLERVPKT